MRRAVLALTVLVATVGSACAAPISSTTPASTPSPTREPSVDASPSPTGTASQGASGIEPPSPDRPFDASTLLTAMRDSRRPGGVPDQLETDAIAAALAAATWTFDGRPWTTMAVSGSCGPEACSVELGGGRPNSHGDDVWVFDVRPTDATIAVTMAELRALPNELVPRLDELARSLLPATTFDGLTLTSARWLPPPDDGEFLLAYRGDDEEGSCALDLRLDAVTPGIVGETIRTC